MAGRTKKYDSVNDRMAAYRERKREREAEEMRQEAARLEAVRLERARQDRAKQALPSLLWDKFLFQQNRPPKDWCELADWLAVDVENLREFRRVSKEATNG